MAIFFKGFAPLLTLASSSTGVYPSSFSFFPTMIEGSKCWNSVVIVILSTVYKGGGEERKWKAKASNERCKKDIIHLFYFKVLTLSRILVWCLISVQLYDIISYLCVGAKEKAERKGQQINDKERKSFRFFSVLDFMWTEEAWFQLRSAWCRRRIVLRRDSNRLFFNFFGMRWLYWHCSFSCFVRLISDFPPNWNVFHINASTFALSQKAVQRED